VVGQHLVRQHVVGQYLGCRRLELGWLGRLRSATARS
jgi:hypothetical protein